MSFDNLCKLLAEKHPEKFANWLLGEASGTIEVLKSELPIEPIRADSVTFLRSTESILHLEFQTNWPSEPPIPFRLLDYWVRLYRIYRVPIVQVVVLLLPPTDESVIETAFRAGSTYHEFIVLKIWEQNPEIFLQEPALLPFAALTQTDDPAKLLNQVSQQVAKIFQTEDRLAISSYVQLLAGLKYDKDTIRKTFSEGIMRESVIYQEILQEGEKIGEQRGEANASLNMAIKMLQENINLEVIARVTGLSIAELQELQDK